MDSINKMPASDVKSDDKLYFKYLPAYATFLLENMLEEYVKEQLKYSREEKVPLLKFLEAYSEEELVELGKKSGTELLTVFAENRSMEYIGKSVGEYIKNQIPFLEREQVVARDITSISFIRRKTFSKFLTYYTKDFTLFTNIMEEIDRFVSESETVSFNAFLEIQQEKISRINEQLELRYEELLDVQEVAEMGSFFWDLKDGNSTYTPGVMKIFEMAKTSNLESFLENVHEEDRHKLKQAIDQALQSNGIYECEYRFIKNNTEKKIWSRGIVSFQEGKPANMKGTIMDVTRKYNMLEQLQQSEELHKQAQAITHIGNWTWEIASNKILWSDELYRIYGLTPQSEEITFERFVSFIHEADRDQRINEIHESLQTLIAQDYVMRIVTADGNQKVLSGKGEVIVDKNKKPLKIIGTCQDVTRDYHLNRELQEKEDYLKQLIHNAPDAVIVIDENSTITLWNPKTEEIFGWKAEEVLGAHLTDTIIPPQYREAHLKGLKRLLETGVTKIMGRTLELTALNKSGNEFYVSITISQSVQQGQSVFIAFIRDISIEKQIQEELQVKSMQLQKLNSSLAFKNTELERINKELESFNYVASHDLQEPLRKIQTFAKRILEKEQNSLAPVAHEYVNKIVASSARMQSLIEDLLTFSQTNAGVGNFAPTDLNIILNEVKSILSAALEEKKGIIKSNQLPVLKALPFQLHQLLLNLIGNAIKYAQPNIPPYITISSDFVKGEIINIPGAVAGKNYLQLKVEDNGMGFEQEHGEKIFGLFQRLHAKDKYSGTGIGLAICKKIAHNHEGFIRAEGVPNKGSAFYVYFPVDPSHQQDHLLN